MIRAGNSAAVIRATAGIISAEVELDTGSGMVRTLPALPSRP